MADNTTLNTGSGGDVIATDDIAGVKYQRVKLSLGADGAAVDAEAGAGAVSTAVQRVTLASDDPAVTALQLIDNAISGSEMQVDIVAALPAGTNAIGTVTAVGAAAEDAAASGNPVLVGGRYDSSARTLETGDAGALAVNASGQLLVEIAAGAGSGGTSAADGATFTRNTTSITTVGAAVESSAPTLTNGDLAALSQDTTGNLRVRIAAGGVSGVVDDAAVTPGTTEVVMMGATFDNTSPDSVDEGDGGMLRMSANRALHVMIKDNAGNERGLNIDASGNATVNVTGTVTVGSHAVTNAGTFATQVDGAALTALQLIDNPVLVDDAAFTPATSSVMMAGFQADEASTDSVDEGDAGAARMTLDRKQIVTPQPHTAGGLSIFRSIDLDETEEEAKATAGCVYGMWVTNTATSTRFIKFYNATAANVTVGTTTPVITIGIPGNSSDDVSGNFGPGGMGITFDTAITVAATTGVADADTGAPGANEVLINLFYK